MIKLLGTTDPIIILQAYQDLEKHIEWQNYYHDGKQAGLQFHNSQNEWGLIQSKNPPDISFNNLNHLFKDTYFEYLIQEFRLFRTRFIWLGSNTCYWFHKDKFARVHIPIITNEHSYFIFKNGLIENLKIGSIYLVDTRLEHTAINGAATPRLHLVGSVAN